EVVAGQGARVGAGQQRQGDDGRGDADADLGEGERGVVGGGGDVAGGEQAEPAGADVPGDPGDDGPGQLDELPQQAHQRVRGGRVAQVGPGAEGGAGVGEDDGADAGVPPGRGQRAGELADEGRGQGVAALRGVEREGLDAPVTGAGDQGHEGSLRAARSSRRRIFPEAARGTASRKVTCRTRLEGATRSATYIMTSPSDRPGADGWRTTWACGTSLPSSLQTPVTAASAIPGWVSSSASSSAGATWKPLYLISSLTRSTTNSQPASSTCPTSPVCSQLSSSIMAAVASGRPR